MASNTQHDNSGNSTFNRYLYGLLTAIRFLTVFPVTWHAAKDGNSFKDSLVWFPTVGLLVGCCCATVVFIFQFVLPQEILSIFSIFLLGAMSGFLHLDGLADSADGFFSSRPKERILEIMRDSRVGPMGVVVLIIVIMLKYASLVNLTDGKLLIAIILTPIAGRCAVLVQMAMLQYARPIETGLAGLFYSDGLKRNSLLAFVFLSIVSLLLTGLQGIVILVGFIIVNFLYIQYCKRKIGGATGDTLGAGCELIEATTLVCMNILIV